MSRILSRKAEQDLLRAALAAMSETALTTPGLRALRKSVSKQLTNLPCESVLRLAHGLIQQAPLGRFLAYELVKHHEATMCELDVAEVEALGHGMNSWAEVDTFSLYVGGPAWRGKRIPNAVIVRWAKSRDRWWRRAALVSTVPLNSSAQGGSGDGLRTLAICRLLVSDRDDMVVKALSWALRALSEPAPETVKQFISAYQRELAPRVIREVRNKLTTGLKNPRRLLL